MQTAFTISMNSFPEPALTAADTDGDGLTDGAEVNTFGTDPLDRDSDNDGLNDGQEIALGLNPLDGSDCPKEICEVPTSNVLKIIRLLTRLQNAEGDETPP